jgi:glycerol-3-phosphate dehydrogenase (NAD(P)+)
VSTIAIMGAGVMASAMGFPACDRGHAVRLIGSPLDREIIDGVKATGLHPKLKAALPEGIESFHHEAMGQALDGADVIVLGVSSAGTGWAIDQLAENLTKPAPIVLLTKGMYPEANTLTPLPDYVASEVQRRAGIKLEIAGIGGPCIAAELALRRHTGTVIACHAQELAQRLCAIFETDYYHPRPTTDLIGVEACAAFKNFFAIAVGWANNSHNTAAMLFDQAITEMLAITRALGGSETSVWGMAGTGDLYVTSLAGRNSRLGNHLGRGLTYREVISGPMQGETIEGADLGIAAAGTLRAMMKEGKPAASALPLTQALLATLTENKPLDLPWADFHR